MRRQVVPLHVISHPIPVSSHSPQYLLSRFPFAAAPVRRGFQRPIFDGRCLEEDARPHFTFTHPFTFRVSELFTGVLGFLQLLQVPCHDTWERQHLSKQSRVTGGTWLWGFRHLLIARYDKDTGLSKVVSVGRRIGISSEFKSVAEDEPSAITQPEGFREGTGGEDKGSEADAELWYVQSTISSSSLVHWAFLSCCYFLSLLSHASVSSRDLRGS